MSSSSSTTTSMLTFTGDHAKDYNTVTIFRDKSGESTHSRTNPDSDVPLPTLEYFALRGLGELPRLLLEYYGMEYKNVYYFSNDISWKARKPSTILGYMPIFSDQYVNNLAESGAICRHLARVYGPTQLGDLQRMAHSDMLMEATRNIPNVVNGWRIEWDQILSQEGCNKTVSFLNRLVPFVTFTSPEHEYTLGELSLFMVLQTFHESRPSFLAGSPVDAKLEAFRAKVESHKNIALYLKSDRRIPMTIKEQGEPGWKERSNAVAPNTNGYAFLTPLPRSFENADKDTKKRKR